MLPLTHWIWKNRRNTVRPLPKGGSPQDAEIASSVGAVFSWCGGYRKPDSKSLGTFHGLDSLDPGLHSFQHWQGRLTLQVWKVQRNLHIPNCSPICLHCLNSAQVTILRSNRATFLWPGRDWIQGTSCKTGRTGRIYKCLKCMSGELSPLDRADNRAEQLSPVQRDPVQLWGQE